MLLLSVEVIKGGVVSLSMHVEIDGLRSFVLGRVVRGLPGSFRAQAVRIHETDDDGVP